MARHEDILHEFGQTNKWEEKGICVIKYIDDYNGIEKVNASNSITVSSTGRQVKKVHAWKSERTYCQVRERAEQMGMRVNSKKHNFSA